MMREELEAMGYPWPGNQPNTGEPFVACDVNVEAQTQVVHRLPPEPPTREVATKWDDDGPIAFRTLSDEEFEVAERAYAAAREEFRRTGGRHVVKTGPDLVRGRFTCASGATASGDLGPNGWHWTEAKW